MLAAHASYQAFILVVAGIIFQSILLVFSTERTPDTLKNFSYVIAGSLVIAIAASVEEGKWDFRISCNMFVFFYVLLFTINFSKTILPAINQYSLLFFNIIFLANLMPLSQSFSGVSFLQQALFMLALFPSFFVLINAFLSAPTPAWMKFAFYIWYLIMCACLLVIISIHYIGDTNPLTQGGLLASLSLFTFGMIGLMLFIDVFNIILLNQLATVLVSSLRFKDDIFEEMMMGDVSQVKMFESKYDDYPGSFIYTLFMIIVIVGFLYLNHQFTKVDDNLAINIALLAGRFVFGNVPVNSIKVK